MYLYNAQRFMLVLFVPASLLTLLSFHAIHAIN